MTRYQAVLALANFQANITRDTDVGITHTRHAGCMISQGLTQFQCRQVQAGDGPDPDTHIHISDSIPGYAKMDCTSMLQVCQTSTA